MIAADKTSSKAPLCINPIRKLFLSLTATRRSNCRSVNPVKPVSLHGFPGIYSFAQKGIGKRFFLLSFLVTKLRGDVHSLEEIAEEEKEEEDVTMVEEESVEVSHSKKKNKKRKLDTSEELPGKTMHSLYFMGA